MKIKSTITLLAIILFFSCSSDETPTNEEPNTVEEIVVPVITSLSTDFIFEDETLTISGTNFINTNFETELIINDVAYGVTPNSTSQITIEITNLMGFENSTISVRISDKVSESFDFFIMPKGWYEIETDLELIKAFVFDDSNEITALIDTQSSSSSYYGEVIKLNGNENGYQPFSTAIPGGNKDDLKMFNKDIGVVANAASGYFTTNSFDNSELFGDFFGDGEFAAEVEIKYIDSNSSVLVNCCSAHIYTNDSGLTYNNSNASTQLFSSDRLRTRTYGKGSDGYFYEIGIDIGITPFKNYVIKSENGYNNWELISNDTPYNLETKPYFFDFDLMFSKTVNDEFIISNDLGDSWNINKVDVQDFFIKDRINWFIISNNNLYSTNDSGATWNLEIELPINSEVNNMFFSTNKSILAGKNILYIKH